MSLSNPLNVPELPLNCRARFLGIETTLFEVGDTVEVINYGQNLGSQGIVYERRHNSIRAALYGLVINGQKSAWYNGDGLKMIKEGDAVRSIPEPYKEPAPIDWKVTCLKCGERSISEFKHSRSEISFIFKEAESFVNADGNVYCEHGRDFLRHSCGEEVPYMWYHTWVNAERFLKWKKTKNEPV